MYKDYDSVSCCEKGERIMRMQNPYRCDGAKDKKCPSDRWGLKDYPLASLYAPLQGFRNLYEPEAALKNGTLFEELNLPFMGESVYKGGGCRG